MEIRPRVSGMLQAVHFRDGQNVKKGQLLFTIDPRPIDAQLAQSGLSSPAPRRPRPTPMRRSRRGKTLSQNHLISESDLGALVRAGPAGRRRMSRRARPT